MSVTLSLTADTPSTHRDQPIRAARYQVAPCSAPAIAIAEELPLLTTNPDDFTDLADLLSVVPVTRPNVPHER